MKYYFQDPLLIIVGVEIILYLEGQQTVCAFAPTMIYRYNNERNRLFSP